MGFASPFRWAGAWFHVAARGGAGAADVALFSFRFPRRRDPNLHGEAGGAVGDRAARAHFARLGRRRDRLRRASRRADERNRRAAGANGGGLRGPSGRGSRPARRGCKPTIARPEFLRGQGARTLVPAGPPRAARRNRSRARRRDRRAQSFAACAAKSGGVPIRTRRARRDPGSQPTIAGRRSGRRGARLCAHVRPWRGAAARQASPGRRYARRRERADPGRARAGKPGGGCGESRRLGAPWVDRPFARPHGKQPDDRSCRHRPRGERHLGSRRRDRRQNRPRSGEALSSHDEGGVGGPYIPAEVDPKAPAFDQAMWRRPTASRR